MFHVLRALHTRPQPYARITTAELWTDEHISARMLAAHLDPHLDRASYRAEFVERSVAWLVDRFGLAAGRSVADFGCGPGLYTNRLARSGARVTGLDLSRRSLDHAAATAHRDGLDVRYLHQNYLTYREDDARYDLVIMVMRDYGALPPTDRRGLLGVVRRHLADGGHLVFDVDSAAAFEEVAEQAVHGRSLMDGFWSDRPYFAFHHTFRYPAERVSLDKYLVVEEERERTFLNWTRYFTPDELADELDEAGFTAVDVLGDLTGARYQPEAPRFAVVATPGT